MFDQMMLQENDRVRKKIPQAYEELMGPHFTRVDSAIEPGLTKLTWTSMNITDYIQNVYKQLQDLELLMLRANELTEFRIDAVLQEMATTTLCQLPGDEPWTVEEFLSNTEVKFVLYTVKILLLGTDSMIKQCRPRSDCS